MKRIIATLALALVLLPAVHAQKLVVGQKAPEVRIEEWLSSVPKEDGKMRLIEFFHTSNRQGSMRLATLDDIARKYASKVSVVVIAREDKEKVYEILNPDSRAFYVALDAQGKTFESFGVRFIPFCIITDHKGRVVWFGNSSSLDEGTLKQLLNVK